MSPLDDLQLRANLALSNTLHSPGRDPQQIKKLAQDFEAIFVQQVFKDMRRTIPEGGVLKRSNAEKIFTSFQDMEAARQMARQGTVGLAERMVEQMLGDEVNAEEEKASQSPLPAANHKQD